MPKEPLYSYYPRLHYDIKDIFNSYFKTLVAVMQKAEPDQVYGEAPVEGNPDVMAFVPTSGEKMATLKKISSETLDQFDELIQHLSTIEGKRVDGIMKLFKQGFTQMLLPKGFDIEEPAYPYKEDAWRSIEVGLVDEIHIMDGLNTLMILKPDDWTVL